MAHAGQHIEKGSSEKNKQEKRQQREGAMIQRLGDKSCSDQVSLVPSHLSLFLGVINQS